MAKKINFTGFDIGDIHVIKEAESATCTTYWHCQCKCGKSIKVSTRKLNSGNITNCGSCVKKRKDKSRFVK